MSHTHPNNPAPIVEGRCNHLLRGCKGKTEDDEFCDYYYPDAEGTVCPECGTPRRRCMRYPIRGRDSCRRHGGAALMGIYNPAYKGGLSKYLPDRLLTSFHEALDRPDILNSTDDIALLEARRNELVQRSRDNIPPAEIWEELGKKFQRYRKKEREIMNTPKGGVANQRAATEARQLLSEIEDLIINGYFGDQTWHEVLRIEEQMRKMRETEKRRREAAEDIITPAQFKTLLVYILKIIREEVTNTDMRRKVEDRIQGLRLPGER